MPVRRFSSWKTWVVLLNVRLLMLNSISFRMGTPGYHVTIFAIAVNVKTAGQHAVLEKHAELDWPFYHQLEVMFPLLTACSGRMMPLNGWRA